MTKRSDPIDLYLFTAFCFAVLEESDRRGDVIDEEELLDLALGASDDNFSKAVALCGRFRGFIEMSFQSEAEPYVFDQAGKMMFHPALFEAAAGIRTRKNGSFPDKPFFKRVAELANGKYHDFDFDT